MSDPWLIIDAHAAKPGDHGGLPHAPAYFEAFPEEPSKDGVLKLSKARTSVLTTTTLETVLIEMRKAGSNGIVILVAHAWFDGMLFPIVQESPKPATLDLIVAIQQISDNLAIGQPIRDRGTTDARSSQAKADDLGKFLAERGAVGVGGKFTLAEAITEYDRWLKGELTGRLGIDSPNPLAVFRRLEQQIAAVRALQLDRVELRACAIGNKKTAMQATKRLFGCKKLVAPTQIMFYMGPFTIFAGRDKLAGELRPLAKQVDQEEPPRAVRGEPVYAHTWNTDDVLTTADAREFSVAVGSATERFTLWVGEDQRSAFTFRARGSTAPAPSTKGINFAVVTAFVRQFLWPATKQVSGMFPLAGMFVRPRAFMLPREPGYLLNMVAE